MYTRFEFPVNLEGQVITVEEFFNLYQKDVLTPEEMAQLNNFKNVIKNILRVQDGVTFDSQGLGREFLDALNALKNSAKADLAINLEKELGIGDYALDREEGYSRKLAPKQTPTKDGFSGGYVASGILLLALLNIGFIIAVTLLDKI